MLIYIHMLTRLHMHTHTQDENVDTTNLWKQGVKTHKRPHRGTVCIALDSLDRTVKILEELTTRKLVKDQIVKLNRNLTSKAIESIMETKESLPGLHPQDRGEGSR